MPFGIDLKGMGEKVSPAQKQIMQNLQNAEAEIHQKIFELGQCYYEENRNVQVENPKLAAYVDALAKLEENYKGFYKAKLSLEGMMMCENCEAVIPSGSVFCSQCGKRADGKNEG